MTAGPARPSTEERNHIRLTYLSFKAGAGLRDEDVRRLFAAQGVILSNNRLRELGRNSDRGGLLTLAELSALIAAWAAEQKARQES